MIGEGLLGWLFFLPATHLFIHLSFYLSTFHLSISLSIQLPLY